MAGLASLTANYTDSEDEDVVAKQESPEGSQEEDSRPPSSLATAADRLKSKSGAVATPASSTSASARSTPTKKTRLVSYTEGLEDEDEGGRHPSEVEQSPREGSESVRSEEKEKERENDDSGVVPMELDSDSGGDSQNVQKVEEDQEEREEKEVEEEEEDPNISISSSVTVEAWSGEVKLPPEPQGECDPKLQEIVNRLYKRKKETGYDMNAVIQNKKSFRNPSIYEKLIQFCNIDETGTNFPKDLYDGHLFGKESYYEELAKIQAHEMDRREKARNRADAVAATALSKTTLKRTVANDDSNVPKRRSKWDQTGPGSSSASMPLPSRAPTNPNVPKPSVPPPQVVSASLSSSKTISAFGPLKK